MQEGESSGVKTCDEVWAKLVPSDSRYPDIDICLECVVISSDVKISSPDNHEWCKITRNLDQCSATLQNLSSETILVDGTALGREGTVVINCGSEVISGPSREGYLSYKFELMLTQELCNREIKGPENIPPPNVWCDLPTNLKAEVLYLLPLAWIREYRNEIGNFIRRSGNFEEVYSRRRGDIEAGHVFMLNFGDRRLFQVNLGDGKKRDIPFARYLIFLDKIYDTDVASLISSCNGLLLFTCIDDQFAYIWNPTNYFYLRLPSPTRNVGARLAVGIGYDSRRHQYKVVAVVQEKEGDTKHYQAYVYRVGYQELGWYKIGNADAGIWEPNPAESRPWVFNGCPYWHIHETNSLVSLDMKTDSFTSISMPFLQDNNRVWHGFGLGQELSVFCYWPTVNKFDFWVREGREWRCAASFNGGVGIERLYLINNVPHHIPYGYSRDGTLYGGVNILGIFRRHMDPYYFQRLHTPLFIRPYTNTLAPFGM